MSVRHLKSEWLWNDTRCKLYSGPSTIHIMKGGEWIVRILRDMSAPCLSSTCVCSSLCLLQPAHPPAKRLRRRLIFFVSQRFVQFYLVTTTLTVVCVLRTKDVNFSATKPPLSTHFSAKTGTRVDFTYICLMVAEKVDTSAVSRVYERQVATCFTTHDLSFIIKPSQEEWRTQNYKECDHHDNHIFQHHTIIPLLSWVTI